MKPATSFYRKKIHLIALLLYLLLFTTACVPVNGVASDEKTQEEKNIQAVKNILQTEFSGPNEEFVDLMEQALKSNGDAEKGTNTNDTTPERAELNKFLKKTYAPYFSKSGFEQFRLIAFSHQHPSEEDKLDFTMSVRNIEVQRNPETEGNYYFTALVSYGVHTSEVAEHKIGGVAVFKKNGKIDNFLYIENPMLIQRLQNDYFGEEKTTDT